jgi:galactokinase
MNPEERARALFRARFGTAPAVVASAPGRVNLIGEHVDYHGGHVLPMATTERTAVALGADEAGLRAVSEQEAPVELATLLEPTGHWTDYVAGVAVLGGHDAAGGLRVAVASDVPPGAGLSSSAALEVATALGLARWAGRPAPARELADLAWRVETGFVGMPCGRMDQMASAMAPAGSALLIDCRSLATEPVPVAVDVVLADSGEPHTLRASSYKERRREGDEAMALLRSAAPALDLMVDVPPARLDTLTRALPPPLDRRVRHVVGENQRTLLAARALERGDAAGFGALVNASHDSLRDDYECSTPRLDTIVSAARAIPGVLGARLVGAGWGGAVLVVAERGAGAGIAERLAADDGLALSWVRSVVPGTGAAA